MSIKNNDIKLQFKNKTIRVDINKVKDIIPILDKKCNDVEGISEFLLKILKYVEIDKAPKFCPATITYKWIYGHPHGSRDCILRYTSHDSNPKKITFLEIREGNLYLKVNFPDTYGSREYHCYLSPHNKENEEYFLKKIDNNEIKWPQTPEDTLSGDKWNTRY